MNQSEEERRAGGVLVTIKYRYLALATIVLSTISFVFCIVYSFLFHFDEVTSSHCNVWNVAPSVPVVHLLLPGLLQQLRIQHVPAALIELPSVLICSCVRPPLVFGVHADFGRVLSSERLRVETKLNGFLLVLLSLPLLQLFQVVVLPLLPLFFSQ